VRTRRVRLPLHTPFVTALRRTGTVDSVLVEVTDADGVTGWGEAPQVWRVTGESQASAEACLGGPLAEAVVGADLDDLPAVCAAVSEAVARNPGAKGALDTALHDLVARRAGTTLAAYLAGPLGTPATRLPTDVTLAADAAPDLAAERLNAGFTVLKVKVGGDPSDVDRVVRIRQAAGPQAVLRVDANQAYDAETAVRLVTAWEDAGAGLELVEQPVPSWDLAGLAWVRSRVATPVMADESVFDRHDLARVAAAGAADLVNVKLAKCGGVTPALDLLARAAAYGLGTMLGTMMESQVGVGAAAAVAAAVGTTAVDDLDAAWWLERSPVAGGIRYDAGQVVLPDRPGLGFEGTAQRTDP
jgi:L-alanine-DL-glutamate epimerase-like enolase superfamily enzyme